MAAAGDAEDGAAPAVPAKTQSASARQLSLLGQLRQLLDPLDFGADRLRLEAKYLQGTRTWVFEAVKQWARLPSNHADYRCFWLQGTGGMGKSVIAAQLVRRYTETEDNGGLSLLAHFFCKHNGQFIRAATRGMR